MRKSLFLSAVLVASGWLAAGAQESAPVYEGSGDWTASYYGDVNWVPTKSANVTAYEDCFVIEAWAGVEGYDLKIWFDDEDKITGICSVTNGKEGTVYKSGYANIYTGNSQNSYYQVYIGSGFSYAGADEAGAYFLAYYAYDAAGSLAGLYFTAPGLPADYYTQQTAIEGLRTQLNEVATFVRDQYPAFADWDVCETISGDIGTLETQLEEAAAAYYEEGAEYEGVTEEQIETVKRAIENYRAGVVEKADAIFNLVVADSEVIDGLRDKLAEVEKTEANTEAYEAVEEQIDNLELACQTAMNEAYQETGKYVSPVTEETVKAIEDAIEALGEKDPGTVDPEQKVAWNLDQVEELIGEGEFQFTGELVIRGFGAGVLFVTDELGNAGQVMINGQRLLWEPNRVIAAGFYAEMQEVAENYYAMALVRDVELVEGEVAEPVFAEELESLGDANLYTLVNVKKVLVNGFYEGEDLQYIITLDTPGLMAEGDDEAGVVAPDANVLGVAFCGDIDQYSFDQFEEGSWLYDLDGFIGVSESGYVFFVEGATAYEAKKPYLVDTDGLTWVADDTFEFEGSFEIILDIRENLEHYTVLYRLNHLGTFEEFVEPITITEDTYLEAIGEGMFVHPSETLTLQFKKAAEVGIDAIAADQSVKVYNLQGVQVSAENLPAGMYIINGKKVIVRK